MKHSSVSRKLASRSTYIHSPFTLFLNHLVVESPGIRLSWRFKAFRSHVSQLAHAGRLASNSVDTAAGICVS